jgi:RNA-binding protein PNO1
MLLIQGLIKVQFKIVHLTYPIHHISYITIDKGKMAHKSHRQKALQSQLEERPAISLITNEEKPKKKVTKKVKPSTTASALASSGSMDVDEHEPTQVPEAQHVEDDDGDILIDNATASTSNTAPVASTSTSSGFAPLALGKSNGVLKNEFRRIPVPAHRMSPLRRDWVAMYTPMVEHLGLQVRMNEKRRCVEIRVSLACGLLSLSNVGISSTDENAMLFEEAAL